MDAEPNSRKSLKLAANPNMSIAEEIGRLQLHHFKRIKDLVPGVGSGDVESVHDMRVATRRLRALIRLDRKICSGKYPKALLSFAKRLGKALGVVRSDDVLLQGLEEFGTDSGVMRVRGRVMARRRRNVAKLKRLLESRSFSKWSEVRDHRLGGDFEDDRLVGEVAQLAVCDAGKGLDPFPVLGGSETLSELHAFRIACKKLRYVLEFFALCEEVRAGTRLIRLSRLQDELGTLHDFSLLLHEVEAQIDACSECKGAEGDDLLRIEETLERRIASLRRNAQADWNTGQP